ncbi:Hpt domain-containing protein [Siculibacillus lacustris]|nr:Hpt domain-containing protein [Siculibacillus lacustris]
MIGETSERRIATAAAVAYEGPERRAPIDLVHLARQTFGSIELEREVLRLFVEHGAGLVAEATRPETLARRDAALHRLKGSASGIGARRVAALVELLEATAPETPDAAALIGDLAAAVEEVARFVDRLFAPKAADEGRLRNRA